MREPKLALPDIDAAIHLSGNGADDRVPLLYMRGWAYMDLERFADGLADCDEALRLAPRWTRAHNLRAQLFFRSGDLDKGFAEAAATTRLDPTDAFAYSLQGRCLWASGKSDQAFVAFDKAIELAVDNGMRWFDRALANFDRGDYRKASADLRTAIRLGADPSEWSVPLVGKRVTLSDGLGRRIRIRPDMPELYFLRGALREEAGDRNGAIADFSAAIGLDPKFCEAYLKRGDLFAKAGKTADALADFNEVVGLVPRSRAGYLGRADIYERLGRHRDAITDRETASHLRNGTALVK
ncbi:MAG: tetratricopeptide repeat protein [Thermoguttaceae bacterium]